MRYLSLFSGIESASQAFLPIGWECVGVAEIEPFPCKVLAHHYPDVPNLGSVTEITKEQIESLGHIDLVVGGFPCQDLSIAGKRKGLRNEDGSATRSGLFFTAMQIVEWANPRWVVVENVPGLYSSQKGRDFASVVGEMAGCEFDVPRDGWKNAGCAVGENGLVEWVTLDAQYCRTPEYPRAVPQRRRRVFIVRDSGDWQSRKPLFLESKGLCGNPTPSRKTREEITYNSIQSIASSGNDVAKCMTKGTGQRLDFETDDFIAHVFALAGNTIGRKPENGGNGNGFDESGVSYTMTKTDVHAVAFEPGLLKREGTHFYNEHTGCLRKEPGDNQMSVAYPINTQIAMHHEKTGEGTGMGIGIDGDPAYTLQASHSHAVAFNVDAQPDEMNFSTETTATLTISQHAGVMNQQMQLRRLTPIECARLQAFPDNFLSQVKGYSDSAAYKALGNSMACNVMSVIGHKIQEASQLSRKLLFFKSEICARQLPTVIGLQHHC